nr:mitochondrial fusion and transport protein ugo1 [Quercus suber]
MDKDRFPLSTSREPNPLRPYYIPPSIGSATSTAALPASQHATARAHASPASLSSTARDYIPELDLNLKSSAGEAWQSTRSLLDALVYRYMSVLLAQPFDVAKVILQVSLPVEYDASSSKSSRTSSRRARYTTSRSTRVRGSAAEADVWNAQDSQDDLGGSERSDDDDDDDIPDYFSSAAPRSRSPRKRRRTPPSRELSPSPTPTPRNRREHHPEQEYKLNLKKAESITHAISALYSTSGAVGLWRASNCTFLYSAMLRTLDAFIRSLLLAIVGLPEISGPENGGLAPALAVPGSLGFSGLDLYDSPNPVGSLIVVGLSSCLAGLLLSPLDLIRTRLIITPMTHGARGLVQNLRRLPSVVTPSSLWLPTALSHTIPQLFSAASPLILRRQFQVSPLTTPNLWSLASFATSLTDLFLRLPLETIVRRAQVQTLQRMEPRFSTVIAPAPYLGIGGTVYNIMYQEGETRTKDAKGMVRVRKGQGISGLVRGWRVGFWGLVGVWSAGALGPGEGKGRGEF